MSCEPDPVDMELRRGPAVLWMPVPLAALLHLGVWLALACWLRYRVRLSADMFADFGVEMSQAQLIVIQLAGVVSAMWPVTLVLIGLLTLFDGVIDWFLVRRDYWRLRLCWFLGGFVLPTLLLGFGLLTLDLVLFSLLQQLH